MAADERAPDEIAGLEELPAQTEIRVGKAFPDLDAFDLVVPSPGVPAARYAGCRPPVLGDIELCFRALPVPIIAVTGTNGKSTVVKLIEAMARGAGLRAQAAGNVGLQNADGSLLEPDGLRQRRWQPDWADLGHNGGHLGYLEGIILYDPSNPASVEAVRDLVEGGLRASIDDALGVPIAGFGVHANT